MKPVERLFYKDLGKKIRDARIAANLTQAELATRVDIDRIAISNIERGERKVGAIELYTICTKLGRTDISHFVGDATSCPHCGRPY